MEKKELFIGWFRRFGLIHGFTMMVFYVVCVLFSRDSVFTVDFFGNMILFSLSATLPGLIYFSRHDLSDREWWIRTAVHFVLLNLLLLPIGHAIGLWQGTAGFFSFIVLILIVDFLVHFVSYGLDWAVARNINKQLKQRRH